MTFTIEELASYYRCELADGNIIIKGNKTGNYYRAFRVHVTNEGYRYGVFRMYKKDGELVEERMPYCSLHDRIMEFYDNAKRRS